MTTKELRKKCKEDIKELQEICQHPNSAWMNEEFAPAHGTGRIVKVCGICEKILDTT